MFTGVSFEQAIDYWKKGREVIVLDRHSQNASGGYDNFPFEELFRNVELLADVPAVENPEFKQAVADMIQSDQKQEEPSEEKSSTPSQWPEVSDMLPAGKTKKELALEMASQGKTAAEIAKELEVKYNTVYSWLNPEKCRPKKKTEAIPLDYKNPDAYPGWNADRKKCKSCRYRQAHNNSTDSNKGNCNYIEIAKHSRGCEVEDCDRYVKGAPAKRVRYHDADWKK